MKDWIKVSDRIPREYQTVLTYHEKDLFPVCAFFMWHSGEKLWLREIEGPEDHMTPGKNEELFRPPTHWTEIDPPKI